MNVRAVRHWTTFEGRSDPNYFNNYIQRWNFWIHQCHIPLDITRSKQYRTIHMTLDYWGSNWPVTVTLGTGTLPFCFDCRIPHTLINLLMRLINMTLHYYNWDRNPSAVWNGWWRRTCYMPHYFSLYDEAGDAHIAQLLNSLLWLVEYSCDATTGDSLSCFFEASFSDMSGDVPVQAV